MPSKSTVCDGLELELIGYEIGIQLKIQTFFYSTMELEFHIYILSGFRRYMLETLQPFYTNSTSGGMFINSCFAHCQSELQDTWLAPDSPRVDNKVCHFFTFLLIFQISVQKQGPLTPGVGINRPSQRPWVIGTSAEG